MFVFAWEPGQPLRSLVFLVVLEAALFFRLAGGLLVGLLTLPVFIGLELWREAEFDVPVRYDALILRVLVAIALGGVVGRLVDMERSQARAAEERAAEAERLRDELGRRIDLLEATSRAARALASSLDLDAAFAAFVQELRGLLAFDRAAILLVEPTGARIMATAGVGADDLLAPGSSIGVPESVLEEVIGEGRTIYREDIAVDRYPEEADLRALGVRSRVLAPLQLGARSIGVLAISRTEPASFRAEDIDLVTLLGRLVATAVQNLRTYEAERASADELRRLSSLRADFVSLVSHELRSPMAAVIGSAQTLQHRWRELKPEQREAFLAVIGDETSRLSDLVGDVLDTSRIEAGTFGYAFSDVDLAGVIRDSVAAAEFGQDEVRLATALPADATQRPRRRRAPQTARRQPDLERDQVLRRRRRGARSRRRRRTVTSRSACATTGRGSCRSITTTSSRSSAAPPAAPSRARVSGSSSRARSPRRTAARSTVESRPGEGSTFTLTLPVG